MNRVLVTVLVLAALGVGFVVGAKTSTHENVQSWRGENDALRAENARMHLALGERGPRLDPGAALRGLGGPDGDAASRGFDITTFEQADDAFRSLLAYVSKKLGEGPAGHLELLDTLNTNLFDKPGEKIARRLLGTEAQAARFLYPVMRFALNHDVEVAAVTETVYRTMAEEPRRFERIDSELLEVFVETVGYLLPGMVGPDRMETIRVHARGILETPAEKQPPAVRRMRRDIQRVLDSWAPPMSPAEALARLRAGQCSLEEVASLLGRVTPEMVRTLDLDPLIGPLLEKDGFRVLGLLTRLRPNEATLEKLDRRVAVGVLSGAGDPGFVPYYLRFTGRETWPKARDFIEGGLQQAEGEATGGFAVAALGIGEGPDADWVRWALKTYTFPPEVRLALERRLK